MRKILFGLIILALLLLIAYGALYWTGHQEATKHALMRNIMVTQQRFKMDEYSQTLSYDTLVDAHDGFSPGADILNPRLQLEYGGKPYVFVTDHLRVAATLGDLTQYRLLVPDTVTLQLDSRSPLTIRFLDKPEIALRCPPKSCEKGKKLDPDNIPLEEMRLTGGKLMRLQLERDGKTLGVIPVDLSQIPPVWMDVPNHYYGAIITFLQRAANPSPLLP